MDKRYLITTTDGNKPGLTPWFDAEEHFNPNVGMIVYDLFKCLYMTDGKEWNPIERDHL